MPTFQKTLVCSFLLFFAFQKSLEAQKTEEILHFAEKQFFAKNYDFARYYYERVFFFGDSSEKFESLSKIADCYAFSGENALAEEYNQLSLNFAITDSLKAEAFFRRILLQLLQNQAQIAISELYSNTDTGKYFSARKQFFTGISNYLSYNYAQAQEILEEYTYSYKPEKYDSLQNIFQKINHASVKTPIKAKIRSMIIPGWGQLYTNNTKSGINSFVLNASLLGLCVLVGMKIGWLNSAISFSPWLFRYYRGGAKRAAQMAQQRRLEFHKKYYQNIIELLK